MGAASTWKQESHAVVLAQSASLISLDSPKIDMEPQEEPLKMAVYQGPFRFYAVQHDVI